MGRDLKKAKTQALDYFPGLKDVELPRFILLSDFQTFELYDLEEDEELVFPLADLPKHVEKFAFIVGVQKRTFRDQDPVNVQASELVGKLHDALEDAEYTGHDLEQFLVRIVFCLFADDTGIFEPRDIFLDLLEGRTREDGSDLGGWLAQLFQVLNTPVEKRSRNLDEDLNRFPYVNGDLFRDALLIPSFDSGMRARLIEACEFDWSGISPAIFGSLFQSVMDKDERRAVGAHYTTEKNILKVIEPLFLDDLRAEFAHLKARREFINGGTRYILRLAEASPDEIRLLPKVQERIVAVRDYRQTSRSLPTQKLADTPTLYHVNVVPDEAYLVIPEVSSERRTYIPIAWLEPPTIPSNKVRILGNATLTQFGLLSSRIHIAWARYIGGRLKSDFQYGIGVVYNTFPMPPVSGDALEKLEPLTQAVLDARAVHTDSSLADLYDPDLMPPNLRKAHQALDQAVDRLYRRSGFDSDRERVEHLLALYEKSVAPLMAGQKKKRRRRASKNAN